MSLKKIKNIDYLENQIKIWKPTKLTKKQKEAGSTDDLIPVQINKKLIVFKKKKNENFLSNNSVEKFKGIHHCF